MRRGGIDCIICMFGAPYPDCCLKDCGKSDRCVGCMWYAKHVFKTKAKKEKENLENGKEKKMD